MATNLELIEKLNNAVKKSPNNKRLTCLQRAQMANGKYANGRHNGYSTRND